VRRVPAVAPVVSHGDARIAGTAPAFGKARIERPLFDQRQPNSALVVGKRGIDIGRRHDTTEDLPMDYLNVAFRFSRNAETPSVKSGSVNASAKVASVSLSSAV
jgi:hypothetical protein